MAVLDAIRNGFFVLVFAIGSQTGIANEHWEFDNGMHDGCLFEAESFLRVPDPELRLEPKIAAPVTNFQCISDLISHGVVVAKNATMSAVSDPDAAPNLAMIVANSFDAVSENDSYWRYYRDCDRWDVSFGCDELTAIPNKKESRSIDFSKKILSLVDIANQHVKNLHRVVERMEFAVVENLNKFQIDYVPVEFDLMKNHSPFRSASYTNSKVRAAAPRDPSPVLRSVSVSKIWSFSSRHQPIWAPIQKLITQAKAKYEFIRCFFGLVANSSMCRVSSQLSLD